MTAVRSSSKRSLAFIIALATIFALALPFAQPAQAAASDCALDVELETAQNTVGAQHTLTATTSQRPGAPGTCGGADLEEIDFEITATSGTGSYTFISYVGATSGGIDAAESNSSPDMTCTTDQSGGTSCTVTYIRNDAGNDTIKAWVDADRNNTTTELDTSEGRAEGTTPGAASEPDNTDVVEKQWQGATPTNSVLDCDDASGNDTATNPHIGDGSTEAYTCTLKNDNNTPGVPGDDTPISGVKIDGENLTSTVNDPGDDGQTAGAVDYNDACTTDANGQCTLNVASEGQQGTANICFWADFDADATFNIAGADQDGGQCDDEAAAEEATSFGGAGARNITDVVEKIWAQRVASTITLSPQADNNLVNTSHTVTATVTDQFGAPVTGTNVDIRVTGRNTRTQNDLLTDSTGKVTFTYTDTGSASAGGTDTITACADLTDNDTCPAQDGGEPTPATASKNWVTTLPTVDSVVLDMQNDDDLPAALDGDGADPAANACDGAFDENATAVNTVGVYAGTGTPTAAGPGGAGDTTVHEICAVARNSSGAAIVGETYTFTVTGPGHFTDENGTDLGTTYTAGSDQNGHGHAALTSTEAGTSTVTVTVGGKTDSGTKTWRGTAARTLDCEPETGSNPPGTTHVVTCTAKDVFGNPTQLTSTANAAADAVCFTESGPGRIQSPVADPGTCAGRVGATLNTNGQVEVVLTTTANETGEQTLNAELDADVGEADGISDLDDECDQSAGRGVGGGSALTGAPAGVCEDTVTKTWEEQPPPAQCDDGVDNDGDGWVDFPDDPGCDDAADDDESNEPIVTQHSRTAEITRFKHIDLPGKKKPALMVKGVVTVDDGFDACANQVPVKVQIRASGEWITRKTDSTNENGVFKVLVRHVHAKYRVVAPAVDLADEHGDIDQCLKAADGARYDH